MKKLLLILLVIIISFGMVNAQSALRTKQFNIEKGIAIQGYDPVAYFTQNKAVKGNKQMAAVADGVTYYFSSAANKELFLKNYSKYEPQYGGWCSYADESTNKNCSRNKY